MVGNITVIQKMVMHEGNIHYFSTEALLECTLDFEPEVHKFVVQKLKHGSRQKEEDAVIHSLPFWLNKKV